MVPIVRNGTKLGFAHSHKLLLGITLSKSSYGLQSPSSCSQTGEDLSTVIEVPTSVARAVWRQCPPETSCSALQLHWALQFPRPCCYPGQFLGGQHYRDTYSLKMHMHTVHSA